MSVILDLDGFLLKHKSPKAQQEKAQQEDDRTRKGMERREQGEKLFQQYPFLDSEQLEKVFLIDYFVAHRIWAIGIDEAGELFLQSPGVGGRREELWPPGKQLEARCICFGGEELLLEPHEAPFRSCTCGIFGHKSREVLSIWIASVSFLFPWHSGVCGEAALWGRFLEGELGWRVQYAYPQKLYGMNCMFCGCSGEIEPFEKINLYAEASWDQGNYRSHISTYCTSCLNRNTPDFYSPLMNGVEAARRLADRYGIEVAQ